MPRSGRRRATDRRGATRPGRPPSTHAIITPVASAKPTAGSQPPPSADRRKNRHGRCSDSMPTSSRATPRKPAGPSRSPRTTMPMRDREERRRPTRDRVDDRQITATVSAGKQHEVGGLEDARHDAERGSPRAGSAAAPPESHNTAATGMMIAPAVDMPTAAARSGSPAVLSRTFQATCRTADPGDQHEDEGIHARDATGGTRSSAAGFSTGRSIVAGVSPEDRAAGTPTHRPRSRRRLGRSRRRCRRHPIGRAS